VHQPLVFFICIKAFLGVIFGHTCDRDIGKKFESGSSKRRNVELEKKKKILNGSLMIFLTVNLVACFSKKSFGDNEGQPMEIGQDSSED
jgi:hypothetical protein